MKDDIFHIHFYSKKNVEGLRSKQLTSNKNIISDDSDACQFSNSPTNLSATVPSLPVAISQISVIDVSTF
jgi:hypothetical protein